LYLKTLGIPRSSGQIHKKFREAYMKELLLVKSKKLEKSKAKILKAMKKVGLTAMYGKYALLEENWEKFGKLMNQNHKWVNYAMKLAGFKEGAGYYNNTTESKDTEVSYNTPCLVPINLVILLNSHFYILKVDYGYYLLLKIFPY